MSPAPKIHALVVEDVPAIADLVCRSLEGDGLSVEHVPDLAAARAWLQTGTPDVIVLDVQLPDGSGLDLLRDRSVLRNTPVVVLSARQDELDRVRGLELGAEDYVGKPFYPKELATRVRMAAARRRPVPSPRLELGDLVVDLGAREVTLRGSRVELTDRELDLLAYLAASPRRVVTRDELLREVWHSSPEWQSAKTVNEHVRRLRQKLEDDPGRPRRLVTVGRTGYRLDPSEAETEGAV